MGERINIAMSRAVVTCDACGRTETGPLVNGRANVYRLTRELAHTDGWAVYVGRSRRVYCPECGPSPGHKMRLEEQ